MNANMSAYQNVKGRADVSGDTSGMQDVQRKQLCNYVMGETSEMVNSVRRNVEGETDVGGEISGQSLPADIQVRGETREMVPSVQQLY